MGLLNNVYFILQPHPQPLRLCKQRGGEYKVHLKICQIKTVLPKLAQYFAFREGATSEVYREWPAGPCIRAEEQRTINAKDEANKNDVANFGIVFCI